MTGQLSRERILEMEEEMNRFEQEIAQPQNARENQTFSDGPSSAIQFIPHQLQHGGMGGHPPPPPPPFPPQNLMGPLHMPIGPTAGFRPQPVIGPMPIPNQSFGPPQHFPSQAAPIGLQRPQVPPESVLAASAAPTVYAAPPVKIVTVYQEPKTEPVRPLPPPPPVPTALKTEVRLDVPPVNIHKGVVGRQPEHTYEEPNTTSKHSKNKKKKIVRLAGSQIWEDNSLLDWDLDDFRIFCGDLGNDVTDEILTRAFGRYPSFMKAKVVRDKRTNKTKGYGFVSFKDPNDFIKAMKEMNGKYVGSRPIKLRKSSWRDRNIEIVRKKQKEKEKLGLL